MPIFSVFSPCRVELTALVLSHHGAVDSDIRALLAAGGCSGVETRTESDTTRTESDTTRTESDIIRVTVVLAHAVTHQATRLHAGWKLLTRTSYANEVLGVNRIGRGPDL